MIPPTRRRLLASVLLVLLVASAGCVSFGGGSVNEKKVTKEVAYDWEVDANATFTFGEGRYEAVYRIHNSTEFETYDFERFSNKRPIDPIGLKFRYSNGTIRGLPPSAVTKGNSKTTIDLPASEGMLAFSVPKQGKQVRIPRVVAGSHVVELPPGADAKYPILSRVSPGGYERIVLGGLVRLRWDSLERNRIAVRYYLERDLLILGTILAIAVVAIAVGTVRYWIQIRTLRERREAVEAEYEDRP